MKNRFLKIVIGIVFVCILFVGYLYANNDIGMTSTNLEADIRSSQKIKDDWTLDGSVSNTMAAYISYPQDMSDHTFSVYVNRPGLSFGYFFRGGGNLSGVQRGIVEFTVEGYNERAFISMNQQHVQQLEIDDGNAIQVIDIDFDDVIKAFASQRGHILCISKKMLILQEELSTKDAEVQGALLIFRGTELSLYDVCTQAEKLCSSFHESADIIWTIEMCHERSVTALLAKRLID